MTYFVSEQVTGASCERASVAPGTGLSAGVRGLAARPRRRIRRGNGQGRDHHVPVRCSRTASCRRAPGSRRSTGHPHPAARCPHPRAQPTTVPGWRSPATRLVAADRPQRGEQVSLLDAIAAATRQPNRGKHTGPNPCTHGIGRNTERLRRVAHTQKLIVHERIVASGRRPNHGTKRDATQSKCDASYL